MASDVGRSLKADGMDYQLYKEDWHNGLQTIRQINLRQLTGAAAKIMSILSIVTGNPGIAAINITLGRCVVAQEVQEEREKEKARLEGLGWDEPAIKQELERKVPIWFRNKATEFFVGEWLGKITKFITTDKLKRVLIDQSREAFLEYYKRLLISWNEYAAISDTHTQVDLWTRIVAEEYKEQ